MSPSFRLACKLNSRAEFLQKFFAQAVKAAVGHDEKEIPWLGFGRKMLRDGVRTRKHAGVFAELTDTFRRREFDRGSRMAQSRRPGQRLRAASIVAFTAVG